MQVKSKSGRVFDLPTPEETAEILAAIAADPDAQEKSDEALRRLRPVGRPKNGGNEAADIHPLVPRRSGILQVHREGLANAHRRGAA